MLQYLYSWQHEIGTKMETRQYSADGTLKRADAVNIYDFKQQVSYRRFYILLDALNEGSKIT